MLIRTVPATGRVSVASAAGSRRPASRPAGGGPHGRLTRPLRRLPEDGAAVADQVSRPGPAASRSARPPRSRTPRASRRAAAGRRRSDAEPAGRSGQLRWRPAAWLPAARVPPAALRQVPRPARFLRRRRRRAGQPVDMAVPVHPDAGARPLAPRGRERVRRLGRRVDAEHGPAHLRQRRGERGRHLRHQPGDQQRHRRVMQEDAARLAAVRGLPPAEQPPAPRPAAVAWRSLRRWRNGRPGGLQRGQQQGVLCRPRAQVAARRRGEPVQVGGGAPAHEVMLPVVRSCPGPFVSGV